MRSVYLALLAFGLMLAGVLSSWQAVTAARVEQGSSCLFFTETGGDLGGFSVCDDAASRFRSEFERWGLQRVGYPVSRQYVTTEGFIVQAFQKAIMQTRAGSNEVAFMNIFDMIHDAGLDEVLFELRQVPRPLPDGWDGGLPFHEVVLKRQALLNVRPALRDAYFSVDNPLLFFGLPTSEVQDMGSHYAIRVQRTVLQEWKENVPWARAGQVTVANGGDLIKELGVLPDEVLIPEPYPLTAAPQPTPPPAPQPTVPLAPQPTVPLVTTDYDCRDFATQADAQAFFDRIGGSAQYDPYDLDRDNDGLACEDYFIPPAPQPTQAPPSTGYTGPYDPFGPDRDCGDFSTQREAQAFFEAAGGPASDRHRLDRDNNGVACESLP
ncbi:MAG: excalibur calcium-binding domain-containing protein [Ardenticatenaceae bacterium]